MTENKKEWGSEIGINRKCFKITGMDPGHFNSPQQCPLLPALATPVLDRNGGLLERYFM